MHLVCTAGIVKHSGSAAVLGLLCFAIPLVARLEDCSFTEACLLGGIDEARHC